MKLNIWILIAILFVAPVSATITQDWQAVLGGTGTTQAPFGYIDTFKDGGVLIGQAVGNPTTDYYVQKIGNSGGQIWTQNSGSSCSAGGYTCTIVQVHADMGNNAAFVVYSTNPSLTETRLFVVNGGTGVAIGGVDLRALPGGAIGGLTGDVRAITSYVPATGIVNYIVGGGTTNRLALINGSTFTEEWNIGTTNPTVALQHDQYSGTAPTYFFSIEQSGASLNCLKRSIADGSILATVAGCGDVAGAGENMWRGQASADTLWRTDCPTGTDVRYDELTISTWTIATSNQVLAPNTINGAATNCNFGMQVAGDDSLLICGTYSGANRLYVARIDTVANSIAESQFNYEPVGYTWAGGPDRACLFDYVGGFYDLEPVASGGNRFMLLTHWEGLTAPTHQFTTVVSGGSGGIPTPTPTPDNFITRSLNAFNSAWGFDGSWLFGLALMGLIIIVFMRYSQHPLMIAIGALMGIGLAYQFGLFPEWLIFVVIFLIIAVAGHRLFGGNGEEAE